MVPTTPYIKPPRAPIPHESINDLPVHRLTEPQIFYPVSESRQFTRVDAGRVFSAAPALPNSSSPDNEPRNSPSTITRITRHPENIERIGKGAAEQQVLQPADMRIPHPHLIAFEHDRIQFGGETHLRNKAFRERLEAEDLAAAARKDRLRQKKECETTRIAPEGARFEFRFRDVVVSREGTGLDGRGVGAPGRRYGVPSYERKRGAVKIPTKVEV